MRTHTRQSSDLTRMLLVIFFFMWVGTGWKPRWKGDRRFMGGGIRNSLPHSCSLGSSCIPVETISRIRSGLLTNQWLFTILGKMALHHFLNLGNKITLQVSISILLQLLVGLFKVNAKAGKRKWPTLLSRCSYSCLVPGHFLGFLAVGTQRHKASPPHDPLRQLPKIPRSA